MKLKENKCHIINKEKKNCAITLRISFSILILLHQMLTNKNYAIRYITVSCLLLNEDVKTVAENSLNRQPVAKIRF